MKKYILTSESVTEGHPDKICDQISDSILDAYLLQDPNSRVAVECLIGKKILVISGEISSLEKKNINIKEIAKNTIKNIGYFSDESGYNPEEATIIVNISEQSPDIAIGVNREKICAGDQGIVYGYACDETKEYMPLSISLAHKLTKRLAEVRKNGEISYLYPDGKSQVSIIYDEYWNVLGVDSIIIAAQHYPNIDMGELRADIINKVIFPVVDKKLLKLDTKININTTGIFSVGGPNADCGLTGRKIVVDSYGGIARHGGGAYSGKDPSKSDRSGAYLARYIAKNIVASKLTKRCEISLSYMIGKENPNTIYVDTFGTELVSKALIEDVILNVFDLSIDSNIKNMKLQRPIYAKTAAYGHFGREDIDFPWEKIDKVEEIKNYVIKRIAEQ